MDLRKDRLDPSRDNPAAVRRPTMVVYMPTGRRTGGEAICPTAPSPSRHASLPTRIRMPARTTPMIGPRGGGHCARPLCQHHSRLVDLSLALPGARLENWQFGEAAAKRSRSPASRAREHRGAGVDRDQEGASREQAATLTGEERISSKSLRARDGHRFESPQLRSRREPPWVPGAQSSANL
jgi:hypothetical protein